MPSLSRHLQETLQPALLRAESLNELQLLASEDPIMARAKAAYEHVTRDEANRRLAETRLKAQMNWSLMREEEREEGREEGRAAALRESIAVVSRALGLPLSQSRHARLESADLATLEAILTSLDKRRRWPA